IKTALITIFLICFTANAGIPYISPGITVAWNSKNTTSIFWKLSFGHFDDFGPCNGFVNITIGQRIMVDNNFASGNYFYTELESGVVTGELISGAGVGAAFMKDANGKRKMVPKGSLFSGFMLFLRMDATRHQKETDFDIGTIAVFPVNELLFQNNLFW
ncbi:MAG: hypothetical protein ACOCW1_04755, partial [Chitinispirillaceae bacterium]